MLSPQGKEHGPSIAWALVSRKIPRGDRQPSLGHWINLCDSGWSHRVIRGPSQSPSRSTAPPDPTATPLDHTSYFPPASRAPTSVHFRFIKVQFCCRKEKQKPHDTSIIRFHLWRFAIPRKPGNRVNHILTGGLSQLRCAEIQTSRVVLTGP